MKGRGGSSVEGFFVLDAAWLKRVVVRAVVSQHLHDRASPWNLNLVLLAHLFNHGIHVITLHDNLAPQQERASAQGTDFKPSSKFGRYRHDYEWLIPSLKFFSPSTLLSRSLRPLHYHELELRGYLFSVLF